MVNYNACHHKAAFQQILPGECYLTQLIFMSRVDKDYNASQFHSSLNFFMNVILETKNGLWIKKGREPLK